MVRVQFSFVPFDFYTFGKFFKRLYLSVFHSYKPNAFELLCLIIRTSVPIFSFLFHLKKYTFVFEDKLYKIDFFGLKYLALVNLRWYNSYEIYIMYN